MTSKQYVNQGSMRNTNKEDVVFVTTRRYRKLADHEAFDIRCELKRRVIMGRMARVYERGGER